LFKHLSLALRFREATFDLVYSHGVLHHTFSTKKAFDSVSRYPKTGGRLYVLVYNPSSEKRNFIRSGLMLLENVIRPFCWRLPESWQTVVITPIIPLYIFHQSLVAWTKWSGYIKYGWREALHAARDRFTPRFAYRHSYDEVASWFRDSGYVDLQITRNRQPSDFVPEELLLSTGVQGVRCNEAKNIGTTSQGLGKFK
jgi:SAM-dependent methyltransferase